MVKSNLKVVLVFAAAALAASPAVAGNGHGRGGDSVCEDAGLIGSAYAACHTYCEALDCDADQHAASDRACERALARFLDLSDGEQPPCLDDGGEDPGGEPQGIACPCAFGWDDPAFVPEGWAPDLCQVYDSGHRGIWVLIFGEPPGLPTVQLSAGWGHDENEYSSSASALCSWSNSTVATGLTGDFWAGDYAPPGTALDAARYQELYAACEAELEAFLARFGLDRSFCTVIGN